MRACSGASLRLDAPHDGRRRRAASGRDRVDGRLERPWTHPKQVPYPRARGAAAFLCIITHLRKKHNIGEITPAAPSSSTTVDESDGSRRRHTHTCTPLLSNPERAAEPHDPHTQYQFQHQQRYGRRRRPSSERAAAGPARLAGHSWVWAGVQGAGHPDRQHGHGAWGWLVL